MLKHMNGFKYHWELSIKTYTPGPRPPNQVTIIQEQENPQYQKSVRCVDPGRIYY